MAENLPPGAESYTPPPQPEEPKSRRAGGEGWIAGVVLLVVGLIFLLRNLGYNIVPLQNWWALFILIPAIGSFATAYRVYQHNGGRVSEAARGPFIGGLILTMVAAVFLLGLSWSVIWPVFLIIIGVGALLSALVK